MASLLRLILLASAAIATGLALYAEPAFAQPPPCYPSLVFRGAPQEVNNEADCRKACAGSKFAAIEAKPVGPVVRGLCRCVNERPPEPANGLCASPCSGGGTCGGVGSVALLQLDAAALPLQSPSTPPQLPSTPQQPSTLVPVKIPSRTALQPPLGVPSTTVAGNGSIPHDPAAAAGPKRNIQAGVGTGGSNSGFPKPLLTIGGVVLGVIVLVPILVVAVLRIKHRKRGSDATYNSTARRMRPVPATVFLQEPAPFYPDGKPPSSSSPLYPGEMRTAPIFSPAPPQAHPVLSQHRQWPPDFAPSPVVAAGVPLMGGPDGGPPYAFASPGFGGGQPAPGAAGVPDYYRVPHFPQNGYGFTAPSGGISPEPGVPDNGDPVSRAALYAPGVPAATPLPQFQFEGGGAETPEDVFRDSLFTPFSDPHEGEGEAFDYVLDAGPDAAPEPAPRQPSGGAAPLDDAAPPHDGSNDGPSEGLFPPGGMPPHPPLDFDTPPGYRADFSAPR